MTITFPRAIPDQLYVAGISFELDPTIEISPTRGGKQITADLGPTLWRGRWESVYATDVELGIIRAWYDTLLSSQEFYGYDKLREYPVAHKSGWGALTVGGSPFDGTCQIRTGTSGVSLNLKTLPTTGLTLSPGDYIAFDYGTDSRALHRVSAGDTSSAGIMTVEVRPALRVGWAVNDVVYLYRPSARMIILPKTFNAPVEAGPHGRVSFEAIQTL